MHLKDGETVGVCVSKKICSVNDSQALLTSSSQWSLNSWGISSYFFALLVSLMFGCIHLDEKREVRWDKSVVPELLMEL